MRPFDLARVRQLLDGDVAPEELGQLAEILDTHLAGCPDDYPAQFVRGMVAGQQRFAAQRPAAVGVATEA